MRWLLPLFLASACYSGQKVSTDINKEWQGRKLSQLQAEWGQASTSEASADGKVHRWTITHHHLSLPSAQGSLRISPEGVDLYAEARGGRSSTSKTEVVALSSAEELILDMKGPSLRWGAPSDANLRSGLLLGFHAGMGRLDDTSTPLPSGGLYIGGMLGPRLGLVGSFSLTSGKDEAGGAIGMAWALAPKYWFDSRFSVRGGPAMILAFDPGFEDPGLEAGVDGTASYALVRSGSFALDLRLDATATPSTQFGTLGVGVNLN